MHSLSVVEGLLYNINMQRNWFVYILLCKDNSYYIGCTSNLPNRFDQHLSTFGSKYTHIHGIKSLVYHEEFGNLNQAREREKQIKGWTRIKKEKLIEGVWNKDFISNPSTLLRK